jgi:hypothetical protein
MAKKSNRISIHLGKISLTGEQRKNLHTSIRDAIGKQIKVAQKENSKKEAITKPPNTRGLVRAAEKVEGKTATLDVKFNIVDTHLSHLTATHDDDIKVINESDTISFNNVKTGDTIDIDGDSNGSTLVTIDINAKPMKMSFDPGQHINGGFFIIP